MFPSCTANPRAKMTARSATFTERRAFCSASTIVRAHSWRTCSKRSKRFTRGQGRQSQRRLVVEKQTSVVPAGLARSRASEPGHPESAPAGRRRKSFRIGKVAKTRPKSFAGSLPPVARTGECTQAQVLLDRQVGERTAACGHVPDTETRDRRGGATCEILAVEAPCTRRRDAPGDGTQERGLARAVGAQDGDDLPFVNCQVDPVKHFDTAIGGPARPLISSRLMRPPHRHRDRDRGDHRGVRAHVLGCPDSEQLLRVEDSHLAGDAHHRARRRARPEALSSRCAHRAR